MGRRLIAGEAAVTGAPALLALSVLGLTGAVDPVPAAAGGLAALGLALLLAWWRARDLRRFRLWLEAAGAGAGVPPPVGGPLGEIVGPSARVATALADRERRLEARGRRLASIVAALPDPIILLDRERCIRLANPAAERTFGLALPGLPLGRALRDPGVLAAVDAALATGTPSDVGFSPATDRVKRFAARVVPIELGAGASGVLLALRERTEQVMIERMRSDFVANASHEIRTPLAAIVGIVETLQGPARNDREARATFLATLASEAQRMQRLVEDLLSLSRLETAARQPPEGLVDVADVVGDIVARMGPLARQGQVALELGIEPGLPRVRGDSDQLHQLLANLIDNALKYGGGKPVRVTARRLVAAAEDAGPMSGRPCVELQVADRGEGIAPEHLPRVTERFYRVDKARSRRVGGTGLGLAIVKHIVRRHQGHLAIESELGTGTRVRALLPIAPRAVEAAGGPDAARTEAAD